MRSRTTQLKYLKEEDIMIEWDKYLEKYLHSIFTEEGKSSIKYPKEYQENSF